MMDVRMKDAENSFQQYKKDGYVEEADDLDMEFVDI